MSIFVRRAAEVPPDPHFSLGNSSARSTSVERGFGGSHGELSSGVWSLDHDFSPGPTRCYAIDAIAPSSLLPRGGHGLQLPKTCLIPGFVDGCSADPPAPRCGDEHGLVPDGSCRGLVRCQHSRMVGRRISGFQDHGECLASVFKFEDDHGLGDHRVGAGWHGATLSRGTEEMTFGIRESQAIYTIM